MRVLRRSVDRQPDAAADAQPSREHVTDVAHGRFGR
jgi:hypothetical protein